MTAQAMTVHAGERPECPGHSVLMRGDNMDAVHWVNKCRGAEEPRSGVLMRMLGVSEMRNGWRFRAKHIKGMANTLADGLSRWSLMELLPTSAQNDPFFVGRSSTWGKNRWISRLRC